MISVDFCKKNDVQGADKQLTAYTPLKKAVSWTQHCMSPSKSLDMYK
jgi:hypothetical protein